LAALSPKFAIFGVYLTEKEGKNVLLFSRKNRQLLGLDITTSSIKLIELTTAGGQISR